MGKVLSTISFRLASLLFHKRATLSKIGTELLVSISRGSLLAYSLFCESVPLICTCLDLQQFQSFIPTWSIMCLFTPSSIADSLNLLFHVILIAD